VPNAMNMVCSRPIVSEIHPNSGRPKPSKMRSSENRKGQRRPSGSRLRGDGRTVDLKSFAIGAICGRGHQAAGGDHHEHQIHHPEDRAVAAPAAA